MAGPAGRVFQHRLRQGSRHPHCAGPVPPPRTGPRAPGQCGKATMNSLRKEGVRSVAGRMSARGTGLLREDTQVWLPAGWISQGAFGHLVETHPAEAWGVLAGSAGWPAGRRARPSLCQALPRAKASFSVQQPRPAPATVVIFESRFPVLGSRPSGRSENPEISGTPEHGLKGPRPRRCAENVVSGVRRESRQRKCLRSKLR